MKDIFTDIYKSSEWGFLSGLGSQVSTNMDYIDFMKDYISSNNIKSVVDLGCGDFRMSGELFLDEDKISYTGIDCVSIIISLLSKLYKDRSHLKFLNYDFFAKKEDMPSADLVIIKDVLQHWTNKCIYEFMDYMVEHHDHKVILITNDRHQKEDDKDIAEVGGHHQLSALFFPLKKYNPEVIFRYNYKEISAV